MDHEKWLEQHDRMLADHELFMQRHQQWFEEHQQASKKHEQEIRQIRGLLARAIRASVIEARSERRKRRELDDKITQLAAAQLVTEEKLQRLIERDRQSGNGSR
ncbi:MAG: hypothetical protein C5B51_24015 [Terriglobia bacterium]|nr:MAG: hypothetical protein C5B51_24015 [Terriglobia bacterium]